jgi:hypothetical protein
MTKTLFTVAALALATFGSAAYAHPSRGSYVASTAAADAPAFTADRLSLDTIVRNWDDYGFIPPTKPAQMRVNGRNGVSISGSDYAAAVSILRSGGVTREGRSVSTGGKIRGMIRHRGGSRL